MRDREIHVAFAGGGVLLLLHVGAIWALRERRVRFSGVAGTSAGAIAAAMTTSNVVPGKEMNDLILSFLPITKKLVALELASLPWKYGLFSTRKLEKALSPHLPQTFGDTPHPVSVFTADVDAQKVVEWSTSKTPAESFVERVVDSCRIPGVFQAKPIDGHQHTDGGIGRNYPIDAWNNARNQPPENLLGIRFDNTVSGPLPARKGWWRVGHNNLRHYLGQLSLSMFAATEESREDAKGAREVVLSVPQSLRKNGVNGMDFSISQDDALALIREGRAQTHNQLDITVKIRRPRA